MSLRRINPEKRALTGPTRAVIAARNSFCPVRSSDSQPGMQAFNASGSLRAAQVASSVAGTVRVPNISIVGSSSRPSCRPPAKLEIHLSTPTQAPRLRKHRRELLQAFQIVHRQEIVDVGKHGANARGP